MYRPRLFFDILPGNVNPNLLDVVLRNSGGSPAYNINCTFDPDLPFYGSTTLSKLNIFKNVPFLEHREELRFFYRDLFSILNEGEAYGSKQTKVSITYTDSEAQSYTESYTISLERYRGLLSREIRTIDDIFKELLNIRKELEKIQSKGLLIKSSDDLEKERKKYLEWANTINISSDDNSGQTQDKK